MKFINKIKQSLLREITGKSNWFWAVIAVTAIVDYLNTLMYDKSQIFFHNLIEGKSKNEMFFLISIYVLLILTLIYTGLMSSYKTTPYFSRKQLGRKKFIEAVFAVMMISFGIILMMPAINILGIAGESNFSENSQFTYMMILLVFIFAFIILPFISFKPRYRLGDFNYFVVYVPILIIVSLTIDFSAAVWNFSFLNSDGIVDPDRSLRVLEFIVIFPFYAMFFSAPRFILLRKSISIFTWLSAIASTMFFVWKSLETGQI